MPTISQSSAMYFPATANGELPSLTCSCVLLGTSCMSACEVDFFSEQFKELTVAFEGFDGALVDRARLPFCVVDIAWTFLTLELDKTVEIGFRLFLNCPGFLSCSVVSERLRLVVALEVCFSSVGCNFFQLLDS
jgi:hypothetical protein